MRRPTVIRVRARRQHAGAGAATASIAMAAALLVSAAALGGCGIAGGTASLGPTTTQAPVLAHLVIDPAEGPIGTVFTLNADGMVAGDAVQFEITFPGQGRAYPGNALVVGDDGTASATYRATSANQPGVYAVHLNGPKGQLAVGEFRVTDGKPLVSTIAPRSGSSSTTTHAGGGKSSTTKGGSTTNAPTTAPKGTTATSKPVPTTVPPTTKPPTPTTPPTTA